MLALPGLCGCWVEFFWMTALEVDASSHLHLALSPRTLFWFFFSVPDSIHLRRLLVTTYFWLEIPWENNSPSAIFFWLSLSESWTKLGKHSHTSPPSNFEFIPSRVTFPFIRCTADTFAFWLLCSLPGPWPVSPRAEPQHEGLSFCLRRGAASAAPLPAGAARSNPGKEAPQVPKCSAKALPMSVRVN